MKSIDTSFFDIRHLDDLSRNNTAIHRLDPRIKVLTTLVFIVIVVSFNKYEISGLVPFTLYPVFMLSLGEISVVNILKRMLFVAPFAFFIGILNPFIDTEPFITIGGVTLTGGWISFISILLRFALTVSATLILIAVTGFNAICRALEKMGIPQFFVLQLLFLYRYIFVLGEEAMRMNRARALRTFNAKKPTFNIFKNMIGYLLLRTFDRAQRIHMAMRCRGFDGTVRLLNPLKSTPGNLLFMVAWIALFICLRMFNISQIIGALLMELVI